MKYRKMHKTIFTQSFSLKQTEYQNYNIFHNQWKLQHEMGFEGKIGVGDIRVCLEWKEMERSENYENFTCF